ncbi:hypothetical protein EV401DRAFT_1910850 [Pisolithus croceorrhizus]|nr:hypothetical protein EV401DRAFT_1910850 [Pisolithus croceorrhizus]
MVTNDSRCKIDGVGHASPSPTSIVTAVTPARFPMQQCRDRSRYVCSILSVLHLVLATSTVHGGGVMMVWKQRFICMIQFTRISADHRYHRELRCLEGASDEGFHLVRGNQQTRSSPFVRSAFPPRFESLERRSARVFRKSYGNPSFLRW